jgi:hypothetical protein
VSTTSLVPRGKMPRRGVLGGHLLARLFVLAFVPIGKVADRLDDDPIHVATVQRMEQAGRFHLAADDVVHQFLAAEHAAQVQLGPGCPVSAGAWRSVYLANGFKPVARCGGPAPRSPIVPPGIALRAVAQQHIQARVLTHAIHRDAVFIGWLQRAAAARRKGGQHGMQFVGV